MKSCLRFAILLLLPAAAAHAASGRRAMTPEDLWATERVGNPAVSPDGKWIVFPVTRYSVETNKGNSDLWLLPADGSAAARQLTWNEGSDTSPVFSPDGQRIAFVSKRDDKPAQIYVLPLDGGEARPVTDLPVDADDPRWFPDGQRIGFIARTWPDLDADFAQVEKRLEERKDDKVNARISENRLLRYWDRYETDGRFPHLMSVELDGGEVTDLTPGSRRYMGLLDAAGGWDIAPDGREIVLSANSTEPPYHQLNYDLFTIALEGPEALAPKNITSANPADDERPRYSPDGSVIVFGRKDRPEVSSDFAHLTAHDRRSGAFRSLADGLDTEPSDWSFTADGKTLLFVAEEKARTHLFALPLDGKSKPRPLARGGSISAPQAIASASSVLFQRSSLLTPADLFAVPLAGGTERRLTSWNESRLSELDLGTVGEETFQGAAGEPVHLLLVYPPGFDRGAGRRWPLLQVVHGGPHGSSADSFHYRWNAALFASRGYVVSMVNFHGSTGYGQAFADSILGNHAEKPFADIMAATDHLLAQGFIDERRMAAAGGSYGGYMMSWILGHTDRFAALVNHAGVYDLEGQFASDATWGRPQNYGAAPWTDPDRVALYSPSRYAPHFTTPTLILHGEKDYRVPYTQGVNLYGVLQGKGVPARIVLFPDENHWILKPQAALLWWNEVFGWLDRYLGEHD
jgi:dipeptidyl aminopeptidase/acylaminoacyl peptidase